MDYLKSLGIYDKKSYKYWVVQNHPDRGGCTQTFIKVLKEYKRFFDRDGNASVDSTDTEADVHDDVFNDFFNKFKDYMRSNQTMPIPQIPIVYNYVPRTFEHFRSKGYSEFESIQMVKREHDRRQHLDERQQLLNPTRSIF